MFICPYLVFDYDVIDSAYKDDLRWGEELYINYLLSLFLTQ